ncbi:MAG: phosphoglycerate kinase [Candidatus Moranbacteria bacterium]|nr:phosphoglycerate kinase [Candidatus Moranbacteria bacterium]
MKTIDDIDFIAKNVLIRCDYNVPIEDKILTDEEDDKIEFSLETIRLILEKQAKFVLLVSHLGRPGGKFNENFSMEPVRKRLEEYLGLDVKLMKSLVEIKAVQEDPTIELALLENIRFWKEEEVSDENFAKKITEGFDVYVNNAFSVSHRDHASLTKFPKFCPEKCAGKLLAKEIENLNIVKDNPQKPAIAVIGGSKIETKLPVIENLAKDYDFVLVGGRTANEALDQKIDFSENVLLPVDFSPKERIKDRLDIGEKTRKMFIDKIKQAQTIVWNGPLGMFEEEECALGTKEIAEAIKSNSGAFKLAGGGETITALNYFADIKDFNYVSMSGGAMLDFLAGKELPGIQALQ